jgi:hypothetical protein
MNVHLLPVILMLFVPTLMVTLPVHVILDTVETDLIVLVKYYLIYKLFQTIVVMFASGNFVVTILLFTIALLKNILYQ